MKKLELVGNRYGRLVVVKETGVNKWGNTLWLCKCDCGEEKIVPANSLRKGYTRSCGCFGRENLSRLSDDKRKTNEFRMVDDLVYVKMSNSGREMMCDIISWNKFGGVCWYETDRGYARSSIGYFHQLVCPTEGDLVVDHINRNTMDNRIVNLRLVTRQTNALNTSASGVTWHKMAGKWGASVMLNGKHIHLGLFDDKNAAIQTVLDYKEKLRVKFVP